jgi:hypothetical protein
MTSSAARCDRILALIDACLDELVQAQRPPVRDSGEAWGWSNVIPLWSTDYAEAFSKHPA